MSSIVLHLRLLEKRHVGAEFYPHKTFGSTCRARANFCPSGQFPWLSRRNKINCDRQTSARSTRRLQKISIWPPQFCSHGQRRVPSKGIRLRHFFPASTTHVVFTDHRPRVFPACPPWRTPLFSYSYELLFPQLLYFDNHPHCPGVASKPCCFRDRLPQAVSFHIVANSLSLQENSSPLQSSISALFCRTPGYGGTLTSILTAFELPILAGR
jgi:hypothetical protein